MVKFERDPHATWRDFWPALLRLMGVPDDHVVNVTVKADRGEPVYIQVTFLMNQEVIEALNGKSQESAE